MDVFDKLRSSSSTSDEADDRDLEPEPVVDDDREPEELMADPEVSVTGEEYLIDTVEEMKEGGKLTKEEAVLEDTGDTDMVAGAYARELIEDGYLDPEAPLWLGYNADYHQFREAGLALSQTFRHIWISGVTGAGKTTQMINMMLQLAYAGYGFMYFDPKGLDSRELLAKLPERRLEDVIFVDPISTAFDKTIAINFLELPDHLETEEEKHKEVSRRISILKAIFEGDEYWGINMETITEVVGRGMLLSDQEYTIIDLYFILLNQQRREDFAEQIGDPFLKDAMREVSEMDDDEVRPTLKRVMSWVLDPLIRQLISHRESTIDFREIIDEDKIVIVRTAIDNNQIKWMVTLGMLRSLQSAIRSRAAETDSYPDPYFALCDEFDDIASEQLDIPSMLARARSRRLSMTLACQYPSQLSEEVLKTLKNNAKNLTSFTCEDADDAKILMERFKGYSESDLLNTDDYTIWTKLPLPGGKSSEPLTLKTFAPYPNLRPISEVDSIIEQRLEETGVDRKTTRDIQKELIFADEAGILEAIAESGGELDADEFVDEALARSTGESVSKAIFDEALRQGVTDGTDDDLEAGWTISVDQELRARAERYTGGAVASMSELNHAIDEANGTLVTKVTIDDGRRVGITDKGRSQIFVTGSSTNAGVAKHRDIGEETYIHLTKLGLESEVVEQSGSRDVDGIARIRELLLEHYEEGYLDVRPRLAQQRYDRLYEEHPIVGYLTDGADVTVEFESTTGSTKKGQSVRNLSKAYSAGQVCVFVAREGTAHDVWEALTEPEYVRDVVGDREIFYNLNKIYIDGEKPVIENARTAVWSRNRETGEIRLEDEDGVVRARFDDLSAVFADRTKYDGMTSEYDEDDLGRDGPHLTVNEPVVPQREFRGELPTTEDFRVVIVPANSAGDDPLEVLRVIDEKGVRLLEKAADSPGWESDPEPTREVYKPEQDVQEESETEKSESETPVEESSLYEDLKL